MRLSRDQVRVLRGAIQQGEPLGVSAITLLEMALLFGEGGTRLRAPVQELFTTSTRGRIPGDSLDVEVAAEAAALGDALRGSFRRLRLATSDQRIIASKFVPVVE